MVAKIRAAMPFIEEIRMIYLGRKVKDHETQR